LQLAILKCNQTIELIEDGETGPKSDITFHPKGDITFVIDKFFECRLQSREVLESPEIFYLVDINTLEKFVARQM